MAAGPSVRLSAAYRIAVNYAAVVAWAIVVLGLTVYLAVEADFGRQRDTEIAAELDRLSRISDRPELLRELKWRQEHGAANQFRYGLFDPAGKRVVGTLERPQPPLPGEAASSTETEATPAVPIGVVDLPDGSRLAVSAEPGPTERVTRIIIKYFFISFVALLMVNIIGGLVLARYLRSRLQPISDTANAIVAGDLGLRVPIGRSDDEFDEAGRAFNLMLDRVAGLMENLRQVSSDIAHDLRKPLMRLLCQTDRLGEVDGAEERVLATGDEMLALFSAILRIAEVEGGGLERSFEPVDLSTLMAEVAESFAPALADAGNAFEWTIEPGIEVVGNKELLAQLAANLLDNARIHTPEGTAIALDLAAVGERAVLTVEDDGPGVGEADRAKLLQRFFRADSSRNTPGNGLGLNLVAAAAQAHGGAVEIENAQPGLRIRVMLERAVPEPVMADDDAERGSGLLAFLRRDQ